MSPAGVSVDASAIFESGVPGVGAASIIVLSPMKLSLYLTFESDQTCYAPCAVSLSRN